MSELVVSLSSDVSMVLRPDHDSEEVLDILERGAVDNLNLAYHNIDEAAKCVHFILQNRLWRHRKNEDGSFKYFRDGKFLQELYIPDLERMLGRWGRASIFSKYRGTKLGFNGLELTTEEFDYGGGIERLEIIEEEITKNGKIDQKTGKIIEYHGDTGGLEPKEFFRNLFFRLAPGNTKEMSPAQVREAIRNAVSARANIWFEMITIARGSTNSGYETKWNKEEVIEGILDKQFGLMSEPNIPQDVLSEYCKRLRTKNPLKAESDGVPNQEAASVGQQETTVSSGKV